jgi:hypothetical protein
VKNYAGHKKGEKKKAQNQVELRRAELCEEPCRAQKKVKKDKPENVNTQKLITRRVDELKFGLINESLRNCLRYIQ